MISDLTKKKAEFYEKCIKNNWTDMNDDTQSLKAKVLAKDMGLNYKKIQSLFSEGEKAHQEIENKQKEQEEKERLEQERLAVKGELIVSFIKSEDSSSNGLKVYKRPDKSFYYVYNKRKTEGVPVLSLKAQSWSESTYRGPQVIYSSATVGGITTGGVDYVPGKEVIKNNRSIRSILEIASDTTRFNVKWIIVHPYAINHFESHRFYTQLEGSKIKCFEKTAAEMEEEKKAITYQVYSNKISMDRAVDLFSFIETKQGIDDQKGRKIINLVNVLFAKEYPKSADETFEEIYPKLSSPKKETVEKGIKEYREIKKYLNSKNITRFNKTACSIVNQYAQEDDNESTKKINELIELINDNGLVIKHCNESIVALIDRLVSKDNTKDLSRALNVCNYFADTVPEFRDKSKEIKSKYKETLQREKEEAIILEEKNNNKAKRLAFILGLPVVIGIIAFIIVTKVIIPNNKYHVAINLMEQQDYEAAMAAFEEIDGYKDSNKQIEECKYNSAISLMEQGDYESALKIFKELNGYKDSDELIEKNCISIYGEETWNTIKNLKVGDLCTLGKYDNKTIEWIVLDIQDTKLLLLTKVGIDCKPYHKRNSHIKWEYCELRKWLNETFYNQAFSENEKKTIQTTHVAAYKNSEYSTNPGNDTEDQVFLLSINETEQYLKVNSDRICQSSELAKKNRAYVSDEGNCYWWLRTPGIDDDCAAVVSSEGLIYANGSRVNEDFVAVRPALWIDFTNLK